MVAAGSCKWKPGVRKFAMILAGKYRWMSALEGQLHLYELTFGICLLHPNQICAVTLTYGHRQDRATPVACWWFSVSRGAFKSTTVIENSLGYSSLSTKIFITVRFFCCQRSSSLLYGTSVWHHSLRSLISWFGVELLNLTNRKFILSHKNKYVLLYSCPFLYANTCVCLRVYCMAVCIYCVDALKKMFNSHHFWPTERWSKEKPKYTPHSIRFTVRE